jgi:branched-chain amino acid transport system ATP-binding protein
MTRAGEETLRLDCLTAGHHDVPVVRELQLQVAAGEVVALLGPNGAGKTTTLLTISGLIPPLSGTIRFLGRQINGLSATRIAKLGIAHIAEDRALFFSLSVRENLGLGRSRGGLSLDDTMAAFPSLEPLLSRKAGRLSGGEQQLLAVARALTNRPRLLIVDEMSLGLAPLVVRDLLPRVEAVARREGSAVLLVDQHADLALAMADRAYVLSHGELSYAGPAADLRVDPALLRASYLGSADRTPNTITPPAL